MPKPIPKENVSTPSRKRTLVEESVEVQETPKKKGRRSLAVPSPATPVVKSTPRSRRSMMPQIPTVKNTEPEPTVTEEEGEEAEEEEEDVKLDISDLGPNPTPQMIELKRKKLQNKKGTPSSSALSKSSPKKTQALTPSTALKKLVPKKVELPARNEFPGENCAIYLIEANIAEKSHGYLDFAKLQNLVGEDFPGAHLTFIHTPVDWSPTDVFAVSMNIKLLNRRANQVS